MILNKSRVLIGVVFLLVTGCAGTEIMNPGLVQTVLGQALNHQVTQFTFAFTLAAWIHAGRVKKEIALQFANIVSSIDGVARALRQDLAAQGDRIGAVEQGMGEVKDGINEIKSRVGTLEKQQKGES